MVTNKTMATIGHCRVDFSKNSILINEKIHTLPAKVMRVLYLLAENAGQTIARETFIEEIWQGNSAVGEKGLTNYIWKIRKTLELAEPDKTAIEAISKVGYSLALPVTWQSALTTEGTNKDSQARRFNLNLKNSLIFVALLFTLTFIIFIPEKTLENTSKLTDFPGIEDYPVVSRDGKSFLYGWAKIGARGEIFSREMTLESPLENTNHNQQITKGGGLKLSPAWSPNKDSIAYIEVSKHRCDVVLHKLNQNEKTSREPRVIAHCHFGGNAYRTLSWSGDGRYIAYVGKVAAESATAIFAYDLESESVSQLTFPKASEFDSLPSWDATGKRLLFARGQGIGSANIYLWQQGKSLKQLTDAAIPTFALGWDEFDEKVLFISLAEGLYELNSMASDGSHRQAIYRDQAITNFSPLYDGNHGIALAIRNTREYNQVWKIGEWQVPLHEIQSSGRELYGDFSPQANKLLSLSNRSNGFQIWLGAVDGSEDKQLTTLSSIPGIPEWSPSGDEYAYAVERDNGKQSDLVIGQLTGKSEIIVQPVSYLKNVAFSPDSQRIYFSSNQTGQWQIWVYHRDKDTSEQLTFDGGVYARESLDGESMYYTKSEQAGLWQLDFTNGISQLVVEHLAPEDWGNWDISPSGVIALARTEKQDEIRLYTKANAGDPASSQLLKRFRRGEIRKDRSLRVREQILTLNLRQRVQGDIITLQKSAHWL